MVLVMMTLVLLILPDTAAHTYIYKGSASMINNPERGFRHELHPDSDGNLSAPELEQLKQFNLTVAQTYWYLPSIPVLSEQTINGVVHTLRTLRSVGVKALFRFAYDRCNSGPIGENNYTAQTILDHIHQLAPSFRDEIDAVYVLQAGFVGCWGEWHGSRNIPDPFNSIRSAVQQIIRAELFELLPADRKINLRYPALKFDVALHRDCPQIDPSDANGHRSNLQCGGFNTSAPDRVLPPPPAEMAFGVANQMNFKQNTAVARLGYDNDAFMCDQFGSGTWVGGAQHDGDVPRTSRRDPRTHQNAPRDGPNGQIPHRDSYGDPLFNSVHGPMLDPGFKYELQESPYVPMDNEMGWNVGLKPYPTDTNESWPAKVPAEVAAWRLREMHYSTMSLMHGYSHMDGNGRAKTPQPNNNETIDFWMRTELNVTLASRDFRLPIGPEYAAARRSGYEYIRDHLGYRLELRSAVLPQQLHADADAGVWFVFEAALLNWGFAAPISPRPVRLALVGDGGQVAWSSESLADPRDWQPYTPGDPTFLPLLHRLRANLTIPASALGCNIESRSNSQNQSCLFNFGLYMPDMRLEQAMAKGAVDNSAYCIRLANDDIPWVGGINLMGEVVVVHA